MKRILAVAVTVGIAWCICIGTARADDGQMTHQELMDAMYKIANLDFDGDGVKNIKDQCPETLTGAEVDEQGCAVEQDPADAESDSSGGDEKIDLSTLSRMMAEIARKDFDGDGVKNIADLCADTPEGAVVDDQGCPVADGTGNDEVPQIDTTILQGTSAKDAQETQVMDDGGSCQLSAFAGSASPMGLLMLLPLLPLAWTRRR